MIAATTSSEARAESMVIEWFRRGARQALAEIGFEVSRLQRGVNGEPVYSLFEDVIARYLTRLGSIEQFCVDIAAADGKSGSNTYRLLRQGWAGLAVECDDEQFARLARHYTTLPGVRLHRGYATPDNILSLLRAADVPERFGFLSLDIDSYDHYVLGQVLGAYRPALVCVEVNEKIPPPILFTVTYSPGYRYLGDHCYGQSLTMLDRLRATHDYVLLSLEYNNAFLVPAEFGFKTLPVDEAYRVGYVEKPNRRDLFPWNRDMEQLLSLDPQDGVGFIREKFAQHEGTFICTV